MQIKGMFIESPSKLRKRRINSESGETVSKTNTALNLFISLFK